MTPLIEPLRNVYGVSDKVLAMALSGILIGAADVRPRWLEVGVHLIAVDTLVHNFLHRTGILVFSKLPILKGRGVTGQAAAPKSLPVLPSRSTPVRSIRPSRFSPVRATRGLAVLQPASLRRLQRQP